MIIVFIVTIAKYRGTMDTNFLFLPCGSLAIRSSLAGLYFFSRCLTASLFLAAYSASPSVSSSPPRRVISEKTERA